MRPENGILDLGLLVKLSELYEISLNQLIVDSFRSSTLMFREVCPPYTVAHREHSDTTLILTEDECDLTLEIPAGKRGRPPSGPQGPA